MRGRRGGILTPPIACVKGEQTRATSVSAHPAQPLRRVGTSAAALGHVAGRRKRQTSVSIVPRRRQPRRAPVSAASDPWLQAHQRGAGQQRHVRTSPCPHRVRSPRDSHACPPSPRHDARYQSPPAAPATPAGAPSHTGGSSVDGNPQRGGPAPYDGETASAMSEVPPLTEPPRGRWLNPPNPLRPLPPPVPLAHNAALAVVPDDHTADA